MVQVIYSYEPLAQRPMMSPESGIGLLVGFRRSLIMSPTRGIAVGARDPELLHIVAPSKSAPLDHDSVT
jgi:hypothetical protein